MLIILSQEHKIQWKPLVKSQTDYIY
jgi:hypothetical protein